MVNFHRTEWYMKITLITLLLVMFSSSAAVASYRR